MSDKRRDRILDHWGDHPVWDYASLIVLVGAHVALVSVAETADVLLTITRGQRVALYGLLASVNGIIFGFGTASISLFYAASHERLQTIRDQGGPKIRRNFMAVLRTLLLAVGLLIVAIVLEAGGTGAQSARWIAEIATLLVAMRLVRLVWLFGEMLSVLSRPNKPVHESRLPVHSGGVSLTRQSDPAA